MKRTSLIPFIVRAASLILLASSVNQGAIDASQPTVTTSTTQKQPLIQKDTGCIGGRCPLGARSPGKTEIQTTKTAQPSIAASPSKTTSTVVQKQPLAQGKKVRGHKHRRRHHHGHHGRRGLHGKRLKKSGTQMQPKTTQKTVTQKPIAK